MTGLDPLKPPAPSRLSLGWYWLALGAAFIGLIWLLSTALTPFVAAMAIAYLLDPLADRLERAGLSRALATSLIMIGFIALMILALVIIVPLAQTQIVTFAHALPGLLDRAEALALAAGGPDLARLLSHPEAAINGPVGDLAKNALVWSGEVLRSVWSGGLAVVGVVSLFIITPVVSFYLLLDWDHLTARIDRWLPRDQAPQIRAIAAEIDRVLAGFVRGQLSVCLLLAAYYATALTAQGLQFGLVVGAASGLLSFIPYVGSIIGIGSAGLIAIIQFGADPTSLGLLALTFVVGHILEGYILTPRLVGHSVGLHPVWLMFALFAFGTLFGFLGLLLAVPISAAIGVLARHGLELYLRSPLYLGRGGGDAS